MNKNCIAARTGLAFGLAWAILAQAQSTNTIIESIAMAPLLSISSELGATNEILYTEDVEQTNWSVLTSLVVTQNPYLWVDISAPASPKRFYRVRVPQAATNPPAPEGMALIPAGSFEMGDTFNDGGSDELPVHTVYVSEFYMDKYEVTKALWDDVYQWAISQGYSFDNPGSGKAANHPVHTINWYDIVKWCNVRSEKEGRTPAYYTSAAQTTVYRSGRVDVQNSWVKWDTGYRLPTEAEWEKAARGGQSGKRFSWGDTISHSQANYLSYWEGGKPYYSYDINATEGHHPTYEVGDYPYTSPVGSFLPNGYGLYDMAGNVWEWCWDRYGSYSSGSQSDPRGPSSGSYRVVRGGSWLDSARYCRSAFRFFVWPGFRDFSFGFRAVLSPGQP